ncbi:MAG: adenylyltransferase/cytidyltransferase family protein [SAR202 cluster bacterium]|nr:adenylyltransferase/cytidyltransferase family protein [SAR202 cluster bacterium]|tara:strand:+ start:4523 stop:4927 length:405 start_codon:yes stop_codon:yes gene_type:complete
MRVYVDMVADLFHYGHVGFLEKASTLGDYLIVGVHSDETVNSYKRKPVMRMDERIAVVQGCRFVDEVVPNAPLVVNRDWISKYQIDLVVHGDDFDSEMHHRLYGDPIEMGIFRTVPYTPGVSTTDIIERLKNIL